MPALQILAGGIQNLTDARFFAAWEANWLAFTLDPASEHYISPIQVAAMREWVEGPAIAGVFGVQDAETIRDHIQKLQLDVIIAGMALPLETLQELGQIVPVLKEIILESDSTPTGIEAQLEAFAPYSAAFILNFQKNDLHWTHIQQGHPVSIAWLRDLCAQYAILIEIDEMPAVFPEIVREVAPSGFCVQGGAEEKVGFKSFDNLDEVLELLQAFR